jgi:hypothetical protein
MWCMGRMFKSVRVTRDRLILEVWEIEMGRAVEDKCSLWTVENVIKECYLGDQVVDRRII